MRQPINARILRNNLPDNVRYVAVTISGAHIGWILRVRHIPLYHGAVLPLLPLVCPSMSAPARVSSAVHPSDAPAAAPRSLARSPVRPARLRCRRCRAAHLPAQPLESVVGRKFEIGSVMQLSGKRDAALPALASPRQCRSDGPALLGPERKGLAGLLSDAGAIG